MNRELVDKLNRPGDKSLYSYATQNGDLRIFDPIKTIKLVVLLPFCTFFLTFGLLSLYLVIFKNIDAFLMFGIIGVILGAGVPYLFLYEDKRVLKEAIKINTFVEKAKKRWFVSKIIYASVITLAILLSVIYILTDSQILQRGTITSKGEVIYDGRERW